MSLNIELELRFDATNNIANLQGNVGGALGDFDAVILPDMTQDFAIAKTLNEDINLSAIAQNVQHILGTLSPVLETLPLPTETLLPLNRTIEFAEQLDELNILSAIAELQSSLERGLSDNENLIDKLTALFELLQSDPSLKSAKGVVDTLASMSGSQINSDNFTLPNLLPAIQALSLIIGNLMSIWHNLEEGSKLM